jgi:hypothetical protein
MHFLFHKESMQEDHVYGMGEDMWSSLAWD